MYRNLHPQCCMWSSSSCRFTSGVHARMSDHNDGRLLPRYLQAAKDQGYSITHSTLLVHTIIPDPEHRPRVRAVMLILEATFSGLFWPNISMNRTGGEICDI